MSNINLIQDKRYEKMFDASKTASVISRQLALSGIAITWMFRNHMRTNWAFSLILSVFILSIVTDLWYYIYTMRKWEYYGDHPDEEIPDGFYKKADHMWYVRLFIIFTGYFLLICLIKELSL